MATKVISGEKHVVVSTTDPTDPDAIAAFETAAGIPNRPGRPKTPVYVNKNALENFTKDVDPDVLKHQLEAANVAALFAKRAIRPDEIAALRRRMLEVVAGGLEDVADVIAGTRTWTSVQVRLFSILAERVMPKLSTITVEDTTSKTIEDLSIEELEQLALGKRNHEAIDAVVHQATGLEAKAEKAESAATRKALRGKMITIASLDEAEKVYVESKRKPAEYGKKKAPSPSSRTKKKTSLAE
jgi:hypothetical protein